MRESPLKVWLDRDGALLRLRLARPKANIVDAEMIGALHAALDAHRNAPIISASTMFALGRASRRRSKAPSCSTQD